MYGIVLCVFLNACDGLGCLHSSFDRNPLVIMPQGERNATHFVNNFYKGTLSVFTLYKINLMS